MGSAEDRVSERRVIILSLSRIDISAVYLNSRSDFPGRRRIEIGFKNYFAGKRTRYCTVFTLAKAHEPKERGSCRCVGVVTKLESGLSS